jgi:hypothetical protein
MSKKAIEQRRRLWSNLVWLDNAAALLLGRPCGIEMNFVDVLPPSSLSDESLQACSPPSVERTSEPTTTLTSSSPSVTIYTFVCLRHSLALIMSKISKHFHAFPGQPRRYNDVIELDAELLHYRESLPRVYQLDDKGPVDKSFDQLCPFLTLHRHLINLELHYVRIALHRPYLLVDSELYSASREACLETAKWDLSARKRFEAVVKCPLMDGSSLKLGGLHRIFKWVIV